MYAARDFLRKSVDAPLNPRLRSFALDLYCPHSLRSRTSLCSTIILSTCEDGVRCQSGTSSSHFEVGPSAGGRAFRISSGVGGHKIIHDVTKDVTKKDQLLFWRLQPFTILQAVSFGRKWADPPLSALWPKVGVKFGVKTGNFSGFFKPNQFFELLPSITYTFPNSMAWKRSSVRSRPGPP